MVSGTKVLAHRLGREGDIQFAGNEFSVGVECFVEVAKPEEQDGVRVERSLRLRYWRRMGVDTVGSRAVARLHSMRVRTDVLGARTICVPSLNGSQPVHNRGACY